MAMTVNGCTTCNTPGEERFEYFRFGSSRLNKKHGRMCQYDYRHTDGELFSCVAPSLEEARRRRDAWLEGK